MITCEICGSKYKSLKSLSSHIRVHGIKSKDYYDKYLKKEGEGICVNHNIVNECKKDTRFINMVVGYHKYCSTKCLSNSEHVRKIYSECRLGDKHYSRRTRKHPTRGKTYEEIHGLEKANRLKKILSKKQTEIMNNGWAAYMNSCITNPSKPQVMLYELVKQIFPGAILNYPLMNYSIDVAIPEILVAIEYDGSYWHQDKEKDLIRQRNIENKGWTVLRYVDYIPTIEELNKDLSKGIQN